MNRLDRLTAILIQLQSKKIVRAKEIADRFDISLRTVYRDIRALENAGVPIGAEAGLGYFIVDGYHLPPVMFSKEEAGAMLVSAKLAEGFADRKTKASHQSALYKIQATLRSTEKEFLESLSASIKVFDYFPVPERNHNHLEGIQQSLSSHKKIKIQYSNTKGEGSSRLIHPIGLCFYGSAWHIIAFCELRKDYRDFRTDRITAFELTELSFDPSKYISMNQYFEDSKKQEALEKITLRFSYDIRTKIGEQKYYMGFVEEKMLDNELEMHFLSSHLKAFSRWILGFGKAVTYIYPESLREKTEALVQELHEHYPSKK